MLVIGGGVAGIEAASAAKSMGASVSVYDKDPAVRDQVEVLGAEFLVAEGADQEEYGAAEVCGPHLAFCTICLLYTSPSPRDRTRSRMPSSA